MEKEAETMTPAEVGAILHKSVENIRAGLRQDKFPFRYSISGKYRAMELHYY